MKEIYRKKTNICTILEMIFTITANSLLIFPNPRCQRGSSGLVQIGHARRQAGVKMGGGGGGGGEGHMLPPPPKKKKSSVPQVPLHKIMLNVKPKGNQNPHIKFTFYYKVFIMENNQWKFEQNQAKNKEVTALWNLAISRGRYSKWWQVVDNSPYVLYMKFHVFQLFWWLRQFPSLKWYDKQGYMYSTWHIMKSGHENTRIKIKFKKNEILCTKWMESCPQLFP